MDYNSATRLHQTDRAIAALRKEWLPLAVSFLHYAFKQRHEVQLPQGLFLERLDAYLEQVNASRAEPYANDAHDAIDRAKRQLEILEPLVEAGKRYRDYADRIKHYEAAKVWVPFYVAGQVRDLLGVEIKDVDNCRSAKQSSLDVIDAELANLRSELESVKIAIAQDSVGQMKREIEGKLPSVEREVKALQRAATNYDREAQRLGFPVYRDEDAFYDNRQRADQMRAETEAKIAELDTRRSELQLEQRDRIKQASRLNNEVEYLRDNLSNIPAQVARIRQQISDDLNIPVEQLPFVGELLKVREGEAEWEGALERLLNSFAQDLLVSEALYPRVSRYVNENNLRGRLVYRRIDPDARERLPDRRQQQVAGVMAYEKAEIKPDTPYAHWLSGVLIKRFAYVCCDNLADFQRAERAITPQGQIKHNASRHEKDDRRNIMDRRYYVLGWDNREKLRQLERELDDLHHNLKQLQSEIEQIGKALQSHRDDLGAIRSLLQVETFAEIDWRSRQTEVDRLRQQLAKLNEQAEPLRQLEQQRDALQNQIKETEGRWKTLNGEIATLAAQIDRYQKQLDEAVKLLKTATDRDHQLREEVGGILKEIDKEPLTIDRLSNRKNELETFINRSVANFRGSQNRHESTILNAMHTFRREYASEGASLTADIQALKQYEGIHSRLETDDLPQHRERFKNMMDRRIGESIQHFSSQLSEQERGIDRSIEELNDSLRQVDYGNGSYIRLLSEPSRDSEIAAFKQHLRRCMPNTGDDSPEELDRAFNEIKALIERFNNDLSWMRKVIDVRYWRVFSAQQLDKNGNQVEHYDDSSGKSGGQKAKLAYTILASAIAYQYGLQETATHGMRSFRLVVIDEAFSKLDDDNARFAMQLFNQLGLQLLVITPMQQLQIVEDYVRAYHVVYNNEEGSNSQLFNLSEAQYREQRRTLMGAEQQA